MSDLRAVHAISDFLRACRDPNVSQPELFTLKARAFDLMAETTDADGPEFAEEAAEQRRFADEARRKAAQASR